MLVEQGGYSIVHSSEPAKVTIQPNQKIVIWGMFDKAQPYHKTCAILQPHYRVNKDLDLEPSLICYSSRNQQVEVTFSNLSTHTVTPWSEMCELQPVTITALDDIPPDQNEELLSRVTESSLTVIASRLNN